MQMKNEFDPNSTIQKTLMTARLFDGFWDRWVVHGIDFTEVQSVRESLATLSGWTDSFSQLGEKHLEEAKLLEKEGSLEQAESRYRQSALYYNLVHWIYPNRSEEKMKWYQRSQEIVKKADDIACIPCSKEHFSIDGMGCIGRVREPKAPIGCIIIVNPIDSTKEELYSYENHFLESGFITVSFDGPGQGETYTFNGMKVTKKRWEAFVQQVIDWTANHYPNQAIHLFGTSSGAAWSIYGSTHPKVKSVSSVSPAVGERNAIPGYFGERIQFIAEPGESSYVVPDLKDVNQYQSIQLFHGNKDVMVPDNDIQQFYESLPSPKRLVEYPEEGHCCNYKLNEVREQSMKWFIPER
ncbi:alpha/beta hydrolase [Ornithinibacillus contaminans]|uniref:alpha/beta hydrolase n=1 Tax=Ornithinibacillus contaminans TaxID=694055 RepID=UPI00064E117B|nr:alpha/beta hydrolase [Ornithinibacillus contaminans]